MSKKMLILAGMNRTRKLEIIKIMLMNGEKLAERDINKLYKRLDVLEEQIAEREKEYRMIVDVLKCSSRK